jgi:hypothetical protein
LQVRRARLVEAAAVQRECIARAGRTWSLPSVLARRAAAVWRYLKANPELLAVAVAVFVALRHRRTVKWASVALSAWEIYRTYRKRFPQDGAR